MKKIVTLILLLSMLPACVQLPLELSTPLPANLVTVTLQTEVASLTPVHTFTPLPVPSATPTRSTGQVSIAHAQIVYYDVTGSTADELRASMNKLRPTDPYDGNRPVDSYTDWYISWNWPGYGTDHCDLSAAVVTYTIKVIMPRWKAPAHASLELVAKWEKYIQRLVLHEKEHVAHVANNYLSVKTAIEGGTCSTAEAEAQKALEALRKFDSNYDQETKHGETQGAVFP